MRWKILLRWMHFVLSLDSYRGFEGFRFVMQDFLGWMRLTCDKGLVYV